MEVSFVFIKSISQVYLQSSLYVYRSVDFEWLVMKLKLLSSGCLWFNITVCSYIYIYIRFYASTIRCWKHYVCWLFVHPSVCHSVQSPKDHLSACTVVGRNSLKFGMLMHPGHLQNWLDFGHGLLIFLIFALFWHSEMGQILCFYRHFLENMWKEWIVMYPKLLQNWWNYGHSRARARHFESGVLDANGTHCKHNH